MIEKNTMKKISEFLNTHAAMVTLAAVCASAALVLAIINAFTAPVITQRKIVERTESLEKISGSNAYELVKEDVNKELPEFFTVINDVYKLYSSQSKTDNTHNGFILYMTGTGYNGDLKIMAGYDRNGEFLDAIVLEQNESISKAKNTQNNPEYMNIFKGKRAKQMPKVAGQIENADLADIVSGASVTFNGVANAMAAGSVFVQDKGADYAD